VARWLEVATGAARSAEARYRFGGITLLLAFLALLAGARGERSRVALWFHGGAALALLAYGLGELADPVVTRGLLRHPMRALIVLGLPSAVLVAFGSDALLRAPAARRRGATGVAAAAAFGCLLAAGAPAWQLATLAVAVAAALALGESTGGPRSDRALAPRASMAGLVLVVALALDTGAALAPSVRTAPESTIGRLPPRLELPADLGDNSRIAEPRRDVVGRGIPELAKRRLGLESLTGYNPLVPWRFLVYAAYASGYDPTAFNASITSVPVRRTRPAVFDLFGVTHFLYAPLRAGGAWTWTRADTALPRAYLVPEPVVVPEGRGDDLVPVELRALSRLPTLDPRRQAILHGEPAAAALEAIGAARGVPLEPFRAIPVRRRRAHRISLELETTRPAVLVLAEPFFPGWQAHDGGVEIPVLRANGLSRALALRPGPHRIELAFSPVSWRLGRWISLAALAASALALLPRRRRSVPSPAARRAKLE
jgi:hypothetical protein